MNSPVKSAQLFHSLPRFPASTWQRKAKLASVYDCVTPVWLCLTVYVNQNTWMEFNEIDHSPATLGLILAMWVWSWQALLLRLMSLAVCFFSSFFSLSCWIPPDRLSPEERRPNDNTAKLFLMKWSILGYFFWSRSRGTDPIPWRKRQDSAKKWSPLCVKILPPDSWRLTAYLSHRIQTHQGKRFLFLRAGITRKLQLFWSRRWSMTCEGSHLADVPHVLMTRWGGVRKYILN